MKILIVGGRGTIGKKVAAHFANTHEVLIAGRGNEAINVKINDPDSIEKMYQSVKNLDAVICIAGEAKWASFDTLQPEDYYIGLNSKLMGQVNLVRIGKNYINPGGSFTLTTGILGDYPVPLTTSAAMVNGAVHSFVKAAVLELTNGIRANVISPGLVEDSAVKYKDYFPGHNPIPMDKVINAYVRSVEGKGTGEIIRIYDN
jgi:NAD(P)-dependent dehydrogenase (short-subunit alcohol dehydrogenase family)